MSILNTNLSAMAPGSGRRATDFLDSKPFVISVASFHILPLPGYFTNWSAMECRLPNIGEWDDWWERTFVQDALTIQDPSTAPNIPQRQESGQWTSDQDTRR